MTPNFYRKTIVITESFNICKTLFNYLQYWKLDKKAPFEKWETIVKGQQRGNELERERATK